MNRCTTVKNTWKGPPKRLNPGGTLLNVTRPWS